MCARALLTSLVLVSFASSASAGPVMTRASLGCRDRAVFERLTKFAVEGDKDSIKNYRIEQMLAGVCTMLDEGRQVHLEDTAISGGLVCVRPRGRTACYWVNKDAVKIK